MEQPHGLTHGERGLLFCRYPVCMGVTAVCVWLLWTVLSKGELLLAHPCSCKMLGVILMGVWM